jgi:hypothetical protein
MTFPPWLLGLALLFWGWQTQTWALAVPLALMVEAQPFIRSRWDLAEEDFRRIANICLLLLLGLIGYLIVIQQWETAVSRLLRWLPVVFFPILAAQLYSQQQQVSLWVFMPLKSLVAAAQREITGSAASTPGNQMDLRYPYFVLCGFAASAAVDRSPVFYLGMVALAAPLLWRLRSRRISPLLWILLFLLAIAVGMVGHQGLHQLHLALDEQAVAWLSRTYGADANPFQSNTAIGSVEDLKQSNRILMRVAVEDAQLPPERLRQATYNRYQDALWVAMGSTFEPVVAGDDHTDWSLLDAITQQPVVPEQFDPADVAALAITAPLANGQGLLKLPEGAFEVTDLPLLAMEQNQYRTVKVEGETNAITYRVQFVADLFLDSPPLEADLEVPTAEAPVLRQLVQELNLAEQSPAMAVDTVETFFRQNFDYSLHLTTEAEGNQTAIAAFLQESRTGHCEYFATATTLLLRAAGIPARYAIGFAVHEFSPLEQQYIVRSRHAHAWALAYVEGQWQTVDTTPPTWMAIEAASAPLWGGITDLASWGQFRLSRGLQHLRQSGILQYWWLVVIPLGAFLVWRQLQTDRQIKRVQVPKALPPAALPTVPGQDSEFYRIEQILTEQGWSRQTSETFKQWLDRLEPSWHSDGSLAELKAILALHYRYRFDPSCDRPRQRDQLKLALQAWLTRYAGRQSN